SDFSPSPRPCSSSVVNGLWNRHARARQNGECVPMNAARIRRLRLSNFRSYPAASVAVDAQVAVLIGPNGAGKTNLIEAISFLAPGRGLRRATLDEVAFSEGDGSWAAAAELEGALGLATLGSGIERSVAEEAAVARKCRIDGEPVP